MLGYSRDELIGKRFVDVTFVEDRDAGEALIRDADDPAAKVPIAREKRYVRKDGTVIWAQRSGVVVRDADGRPVYALGSIEDISEYRAAQEALQALNESLRAVVETSPLAIYSLSPAGLVTIWNPAAERMFGIGKEAAVGISIHALGWQNSTQVAALLLEVLAGETIYQREFSRVSSASNEGTAAEVSVSAAPLRGRMQEIVGVLLTCSDVSDLKRTSRALDQQLRFNQQLLEMVPSPVFYRQGEGGYLGFNRAWEEFFAQKREDWIGKRPVDFLGEEAAGRAEAEDREVMATGRIAVSEAVVRDGRGVERHVVRHVSRYTDADGNPAGVIGILTDITDFKQVAQALEASEGRFKALTESAMDIVTVLDANGLIRYQSPSVRHLLGFEPGEMIGKNQFDLVHRDDAESMREKFRSFVESGERELEGEFRVRNAAGFWRTLESVGKNCLDNPEVRGIIVNTRDITDRKNIQERIQHLAYHDALTGLPNRSLMQDRISQAIGRADRSAKRFAVMFIDIDNFKNINDTLGHDVGDELLRQVATRLTDSVRTHDTIARQGGDEFIVLLDQLEGHRGATRVAQKILDTLRAAFHVGGTDQHVSGSIGIALYPDDGRDAPTLLKNADTAMFHGKALGKNTYQFFTTQMNIAVKRRAALESNLRAAVNNGDFALAYQPQIDLNTGEIVAFEALVRWVSEDSGTMMPGEFIPLAEETGLINEIGEWVLREACRQAAEWLRAGFPKRRMAVNLSARQLSDKGFIEMLESVIKQTGLDPNLLELEITESQVMRQGEGSVTLLNEIASMGVHLAVDDFGTGYSSLSYLKRLPIGKLKIDQSFVRDITVDPNDTAIVVAIINMAKSLDLDIIAEGIETAGQLTLLRAKGCSVGQGFYFSVPASAEELGSMLGRKSIFDEGGQYPRA
jgi:diguanylate cyclase (GGDEF)-like protein/PAS domain S-box-containing protein